MAQKATDDGLFQPGELDEWETRVLDLLCREGRYHSSVALAADLYGATEEIQETRVLEWNLVELLLADLNDKGYVTYRLGQFDIYIHLRPTKAAYSRLGLTRHWMYHSGSHLPHIRAEPPIHNPNDRTDFRTHGYEAQAEPVTTEDFVEHCDQCDHLAKHTQQLIEMFGTDQLRSTYREE